MTSVPCPMTLIDDFATNANHKLCELQSPPRTTSSIPTAQDIAKQQAQMTLGERFGCPEGVDSLGRKSWAFLHTTAAYYPEKPSQEDKTDMLGFLKALGKFYPCHVCASHLRYATCAQVVRNGRCDNRRERGGVECGIPSTSTPACAFVHFLALLFD